jgi:YfiR/HmsC-like
MRQGQAEARKGATARETRRRWRAVFWPAFTVLVASAALFTATAVRGRPRAPAISAPLEYEVKAAFLFRFAQFVEWPADTFKESSEPFTYCTIGDDPFHGALERTLTGKTIGQRQLRVEHLSGTSAGSSTVKIAECQVLFVGEPADRKHVAETLASAGSLPILTVGERDQFAANGGAIGFCTEDNKIRFEVNLDAAEKAGLKISAKLLALAKTVLGAPKGNVRCRGNDALPYSAS